MKYSILVYLSEDDIAAQTDPARAPAHFAAYAAYAKALSEAGVLAGGAGLQTPGTATTVRLRGGARQVQDGPFAVTKEQLAGFFTIEVPDLDRALEWAARCPSVATGSAEVRPHLPAMAGS